MANQAAIVRRVAEEVFAEKEQKVEYLVGTMIELPRAALVADEIAKEAEFFSFGTNDLTQTTFGFSRDDIGKICRRILPRHPEAGSVCDAGSRGRGQLIKMAVEKGRKRARQSRWASAASTAANHRRWSSARRSASTTCRVLPSAC